MDTPPIAAERTATRTSIWGGLGVGVVAAVIALVPWVLTGMRLPAQNLWPTMPDEIPLVAWPINQYYLELHFAMAGVAGAIGGLAVRLLRWGPPAAWMAGAGILLMQGGALVHALVTTAATLEPDLASRLYLVLIGASSAVIIVCGALLARVVAARVRVAVVALAIAAVAARQWSSAVVLPVGDVTPEPWQTALLTATPWVPAVLIGAALAWCGLRRPIDVLPWSMSLAVLFVLPAAIAAVVTPIGYRVYWRMPEELVAIAGETLVTRLTSGAWSYALPSVGIALAIGLLGVIVRALVRSARTARRAATAIEP